MSKKHICPNFGDFLKKEEFKDITSTFDDLVKWQNEEIQRLKEENKELKKENEELHKYKWLFGKAKEFKEKSDKYVKKTRAENEDLKDSLRRTVCQAECFRYKESKKYKQALEDIREVTKKYYISDKKLLATGIGINPYGAIIEIQDKINEVLKDE